MNTRFPSKLDAITEAPEPFRSALKKRLRSDKRIRLLVHAPSFSTGKKKLPATLLAVTAKGWLVASDYENNGTSVSASIFNETLFLELTSILLFGLFSERLKFAKSFESSSLQIDLLTKNAPHSVNSLAEDRHRDPVITTS